MVDTYMLLILLGLGEAVFLWIAAVVAYDVRLERMERAEQRRCPHARHHRLH